MGLGIIGVLAMRKTLIFVLGTTLAASSLCAQSFDHAQAEARSRRSPLWKASIAALAASTVFDAQSSWGRPEANPLLRGNNGRFGWQGIALKAAVAGGVLGAQHVLLRKNPNAEKYGTMTNFVMSGVLTGAAVYNHQKAVPRGRPVAVAAPGR